jgi:hypothetical protein
VDLDGFIVGAFCIIDDALRDLPASRLRTRGPAPLLADSEVLTLEVVGEFLGLDQDVAIYRYFRRHYGHFFPALSRVPPHHLRAPGSEPVGRQGMAVAVHR